MITQADITKLCSTLVEEADRSPGVRAAMLRDAEACITLLHAENVALKKACRAAIEETNEKLAQKPSPQKFGAPYGPLAEMARLLAEFGQEFEEHR